MIHPRRLLLLLVVGILVGYAWWRHEHRDVRRVAEKFTPLVSPKLSLDDVKVLAAIDAEYTRLVQSVVPSVVSITSSRTVTQLAPLTIEDLLTGRQRTQRAKSTSLGSGVIVSKEGHILTNHHVIAGMTEVRVQLTDGRNLAAALIGSDPATDIAVLRIDAPGIEPLPLGDSDVLRVGQQVFAVGNPYGLDESVTRGIVSAKGRQMSSDSAIEHIQHDAAVNQGNSGGPLLNVRGEIIGINSQIFSRTGGWQGISFAIPSNTARRVLDGIIKRGRMVRSYLGVVMQEITPVLAKNFGLADAEGAIITEVAPDSPAARSGLLPGDVVRMVNGKRVKGMQQLRQIIASTEVGQDLEIGFIRSGAEQKAKAKIVEMPAELSSLIPGR
ncbi:MAG: trypsin-like peptidase domain-containing protein [Verrucomicrobia bacterium]|nr:trypsin-like peptidase domain-containing protein [Verrucomicrobiota bacterium]